MFALLLAWVHGALAVDAINALSPALRAAIVSGNPSTVKQVITILSGGNPTNVANLSLGNL
jgi:hypothetical protein